MTKIQSGNAKSVQVNEAIIAKQVRLIGIDGEMIGIVDTRDALKMAYDNDLDLVNVAPDADIPVCKILDYGKYKYDTQKKKNESKKKQKTVDIKEIQLRPAIGDNDLLIKCKAAERFLKSGNKVKVVLRFRGREIGKQEIGLSVVQKLIDYVSEYAKEESAPKLDGKTVMVMLAPKQ